MVAAGVYLVGRFFPLFTDDVLLYIAYTGGITLFIAATIAMVQTDYKKVLAYSTVSQLGFMMLALGVGGWAAGLFHLLTHAFFKALLFLGAGSVYHSVHTYEMPALGGLLQEDADHGAARCWSARWRSRACRSSAGSTRRTRSSPPRMARVMAESRALPALRAAGGRRGDHGVLHVPDVVPGLRRRAARLPVDGRERLTPHAHDEEHALDHGHGHGHGRRPRPQPGRPRPRERADHDLAADHPGGLAASSSAGRCGMSSRSRSARRSWSRCSTTASRTGRIDLELDALH